MNFSSRALRIVCLSLLFQGLFFGNAAAKIFTVGGDGACSFSDLQPAIEAGKGNDEIHVALTSLSDQHLVISSKMVLIIGGYANCSEAFPSLQTTTLVGREGDSVMAINGDSHVGLKNLSLVDGFMNNTDSHGGGINFTGHGSLDLESVIIEANTASYGGGVNVSSDGYTEVHIKSGTVIAVNTALREGGGINIEGDTRLFILEPNTMIEANNALGQEGSDAGWGYGGGIQVNAPARADIGSPGYHGLGVITGNGARYGGGIAVRPGGNVRIFSTDATQPVTISNNAASHTGGGIYVASDSDHIGQIFGNVYRIDHNTAANGAAIYADTEGSNVLLNEFFIGLGPPYWPERASLLGAVFCPTGAPCNTIDDNTATQSGGAIVLIQDGGSFKADRVELRRNVASRVMQSFDTFESNFENCLIANNFLHSDVIDIEQTTQPFAIVACTVTDNALDAGNSVISTSGNLSVHQSILWQSNRTLIKNRGGTISGEGLIVSEDSSTSDLQQVKRVDDPGFINASTGDYHLKATSPAIDFLDASLESEDLDSKPRGKTLFGSTFRYDIGAYERQFIPEVTFPSFEYFGELDPSGLELPAGWMNIVSGASAGWFIVKDGTDNGTLTAHTTDPGGLDAPPGGTAQSDSNLITPSFPVDRPTLLTFYHRFSLEGSYDGAILEISIGGGAFTEITAAGGHFVVGGYNGELLTGATPNPIEQDCRDHHVTVCSAWTAGSGPNGDGLAYSSVVVKLPRAAVRQTVQLLWRVGSDGNGPPGYEGYYLDNVSVSDDPDYIFANGFGPLSTDP